jgi:hypothetical protein
MLIKNMKVEAGALAIGKGHNFLTSIPFHSAQRLQSVFAMFLTKENKLCHNYSLT